jgi:Zn-finger protein
MLINKECIYFPCHEEVKDCTHCFCPLYHYKDCGGKYVVLNNGFKDCSNCSLPHSEDGKEYIIEFIKKKEMLWL